MLLLRPCLADPPAESPSTMNSSVSSRSVDLQSASLPGRLSSPAAGPASLHLIGRGPRCLAGPWRPARSGR